MKKIKVMWKPHALWSNLHKTLFDGLLTNCSYSARSGKLIFDVKLTEICLCVTVLCWKRKVGWMLNITYYSELNLLHRQKKKNHCLQTLHIQRMLQGLKGSQTQKLIFGHHLLCLIIWIHPIHHMDSKGLKYI